MPKQKTHKGTAKRVRVTGSGKLVARAHEQPAQVRGASPPPASAGSSGIGVLSPADAPRMKKLLGL